MLLLLSIKSLSGFRKNNAIYRITVDFFEFCKKKAIVTIILSEHILYLSDCKINSCQHLLCHGMISFQIYGKSYFHKNGHVGLLQIHILLHSFYNEGEQRFNRDFSEKNSLMNFMIFIWFKILIFSMKQVEIPVRKCFFLFKIVMD